MLTATRTGYPAWEDTPPTVWTRPWDKVYCCPTAAKPPGGASRVFYFLQYLQVKRRADERTRTADLLHLRVCGQWLLSVAQAFKFPIGKGFSVPRIARY